MDQTPTTNAKTIAEILDDERAAQKALERARSAAWVLAMHVDMVERIDSDPSVLADRSIVGAKTRRTLTDTYLSAFRGAVADWEALR